MMQCAFLLDVCRFAKLIKNVIEQDNVRPTQNAVVYVKADREQVCLFITTHDGNLGFYYISPIEDAILQPIENEPDTKELKSAMLLVDLELCRVLIRNYCEYVHYKVVVSHVKTKEQLTCVYRIENPEFATDYSMYDCDVSFKDYSRDYKARERLFAEFAKSSRKTVAAQVVSRENLKELYNIEESLPMSPNYRIQNIFVYDSDWLYYCQGPTCMRKRWDKNPFIQISAHGRSSISVEALKFLVENTNVNAFKLSRDYNGLHALRAKIDNITVGYTWNYDAIVLEDYINLVYTNIIADLQNTVATMKTSDLYKISRSGLRKNVRVSRYKVAYINWPGSKGSAITINIPCPNAGNYIDSKTFVTDVWGLPGRAFQVYRLQVIVRLLQLYKYNKVIISTKAIMSKFESVTFSTENNDFCISLLPIRT